MKSILIIDTPNDCYDCPCYYEDRNICEATLKKVKDVDIEKPSWCPLRPLPQKKSHKVFSWNAEKIETTNDYEDGWNDCLEKITGENE